MSRNKEALMNSPLLAKALEMLKLLPHGYIASNQNSSYLRESGIQPSDWIY